MDLPHFIFLGTLLGLTSGTGVLPLDFIDAAVGEDVMFTTTLNATQIPFTSVLWEFDGKGIIISSVESNKTALEYYGRVSVFLYTGSLELRNVTITDTGQYRVNITGADGEETGTTNLTVWEIISDVLVTSSTNLPAEGASLNLTCEASGSVSSREWLKNGSPLNPSENIQFYNQSQTLSFRALGRGDSGRYSCRIRNPFSTQEAIYYMNVIYGPENLQISGPKEVQVQTEFKLSCSAEAVPAASFVWIKNGTTVAHSSEFSKNRSELSDSGEYTCRATNDLTLKTSNVSQTVLITEAPKESLSAGAIAGITIACLVVAAGAAVGGFFLYKYFAGRRQNRNRVQRQTAPNTRMNDTSNAAKRNDSTRSARASNAYIDEPVYENTAPIYDQDL